MRRLAAAVLAVLALAGCGTTEREGTVGDTLEGRYVAATLLAFDRSVPPASRGDVTGFGTPRSGMRFAAAKVSACTDEGQAIIAYHFVLEHTDGEARVKQPQSLYDDDFDTLRNGCERGWLVFEIPAREKPQALTFSYDNTGSGIGGAGRPAGSAESHLRFRWSLG